MNASRSITPSVETILRDPAFFLQRIDLDTGRLEFIETSRKILSSAAFIDGRSELSSRGGRRHSVDLQEALSWQEGQQGQEGQEGQEGTDRFVFHMSFCGSTLLARTCDIAGKSFSYREPQVLIDLAGLKARNHAFYQDRGGWEKLVDLILQKFRQGWTPGEVTVIKPSNWVNSILPDLLHCRKTSKAVFLTISPRKFLIAVFRGGRERIAYSCNFLLHMQTAFPEFSPLIERAAPLGSDPLSSAARLILLAFHVQRQAFEKVTGNTAVENHCCLAFGDLVARPDECLALVSQTLGIGLDTSEIRQSVDHHFTHYSKNEQQSYDINSARKNDDTVEQEYGPVIDQAFDWYDDIMCN